MFVVVLLVVVKKLETTQMSVSRQIEQHCIFIEWNTI